MVRRPRKHDRNYYRRHIYGRWNPETSSGVWLENHVYQQLMKDLEYLRAHPKNANPEEVLRLLGRIMAAWKDERGKFQDVMKEMIQHYKEAVSVIEQDEKEINSLRQVIDQLEREIDQAIKKQNEIQREIDEIKKERRKDQELAVEYRNKAVEAFNGIVDDIYFKKYASAQLVEIESLLNNMDRLPLGDQALQGLAVECLGKIHATRQDVERKKAEFAMLHAVVTQQAKELLEQFEKWRDDMYFDNEEEYPSKHVDMGFWSRGYFDELMQQVRELCHRLETAPQTIGYMPEQLKEDMTTIVQLRKEGEEVVEDVLCMSHQSEMMEVLGHIAAIILAEEYFFRLIFWGYNDNDERDSFVVQMLNHTCENKIQLIFTPVDKTNSICLYQFCVGQHHDEARIQQLLNSLFNEFGLNGITVRQQGASASRSIVESLDFTKPGNTIHLPAELNLLRATSE